MTGARFIINKKEKNNIERALVQNKTVSLNFLGKRERERGKKPVSKLNEACSDDPLAAVTVVQITVRS